MSIYNFLRSIAPNEYAEGMLIMLQYGMIRKPYCYRYFDVLLSFTSFVDMEHSLEWAIHLKNVRKEYTTSIDGCINIVDSSRLLIDVLSDFPTNKCPFRMLISARYHLYAEKDFVRNIAVASCLIYMESAYMQNIVDAHRMYYRLTPTYVEIISGKKIKFSPKTISQYMKSIRYIVTIKQSGEFVPDKAASNYHGSLVTFFRRYIKLYKLMDILRLTEPNQHIVRRTERGWVAVNLDYERIN